MKKQIIEMLKNAPVNSKWRNYLSWEKEKFHNLWDFVKDYNIKITKNASYSKDYEGHYYNIVMSINLTTVKTIAPYHEIEREVGKMMAYRAVYLGDHTKISTRLRDYDIG